MTAHRDLKRIIRKRQRETGESYTAARAVVMRDRATLLGLAPEAPVSHEQPRDRAAEAQLNPSECPRYLGEDVQKHWAAVVAAVEDGDDAGDGLQLAHLWNATHRSFDEEGRFTFVTERPRDILERRATNTESSAYQLEEITYALSDDGLSVLSRIPGKPILDIPRLADEFVEPRIESIADRCPTLLTCTDEQSAQEVAEQVASSVDWTADHEDAFEEAGVPQSSVDVLDAHCVEQATNRLLQLWERRVD